jgi:DNA-binding NtrC family response regulator
MAKPSVLFVDDEERIVNLLKVMFRADFLVHTAVSAQGALEILREHSVNVIVSDQRMPVTTGVELLNRVRQLSPNTMRILLTGYADLAAIVGSVNEGAVYRFINKPWDNNDLREAVREAAEIAVSTAGSRADARGEFDTVSDPSTAGLLVVDDDEPDRLWFQRNFASDYRLFTATDIGEAISVLEREDVGVIITDARVRGEETLSLLRVLKQKYPIIMTVMLTRSTDTELVIKLINEARVCRVAFKPLKHGAVDLAVKAAMRQHGVYRSNPNLLRHETVARSDETEKSLLGTSLMGRLRSLRARLSW